jgi:DnaK suppressor protein
MDEKDYMNEAQLAFFKARLQQLEKDLLKNADETTEHLRETVLVPDPADRATIEEEHALELRTRDRERKLLKKVQQSIVSIDNGEYGWCEETGEPIGIPRLLARPTATLSLEAQQRRELKQKALRRLILAWQDDACAMGAQARVAVVSNLVPPFHEPSARLRSFTVIALLAMSLLFAQMLGFVHGIAHAGWAPGTVHSLISDALFDEGEKATPSRCRRCQDAIIPRPRPASLLRGL